MNNKIFLWLLCVLMIASAGCSKSAFLDINENPNNPLDVPPNVLLSSATYTTAFANANELSRVASLLIQHNAGVANQAVGFDIYNLDGNFDNSWNFEIYAGALPAIQALIDKTDTTGLGPNYAGIGKILKAYLLAMATDLWGDVPYSQAGYGLKFQQPRFDKQEDIYQGNASLGIQSLFDLVKAGIADLKKTTPTGGFPVTSDADRVYGGSTANWVRAGNTLLLKLAMTISNVNPTLAKSVIDGVIADNQMISVNGQDLEVPYGTSVGSQSPLYSFNEVNRPTDMMLSTRFLNLMTTGLNAKAYLQKMYSDTSGVFVPYENGSGVTPPGIDFRSKYHEYVLISSDSTTTPVRLLTNSQRAFILAESALILNTAGDPNTLFREGIFTAMLKAGFDSAAINTYFAANPAKVTLTGSIENKREQIITWKYAANIVNPLEAYNDYRRTGYPELQPALNASGDDPSVIPKRFTYPPNETSANPNMPKPRPLTNQKVWWGK
ncbi:SusD/RagB family nutrient-binding outer membrane lipoprotein [Pseudobacter ginsenosidimutans]|uniref:SusD-like starch-binding protein associating with outer membrane n=1 Tax=Pseudobacter ginsenosidimutans TaxID=661488 RepID=A0A4V2F234_9BACT|nr:SusD/RagB family nutrient-binding outer membrane lipoprotein [Pseudobacter ginsenosidimutans]QEC44416.1 SusD/RagB family nutrient-binding outer membrane lipoprotein [Pseudobacter ginsenosidimutans]RZS75887.1 SusD-like starch-binding protein associating with outer membrane [Pseudobacter ginsenosidimutans]